MNIAINNGNILTWQVDEDGDYTISRLHWFQHAWLRPQIDVNNKSLAFGIVQSSVYPMTRQLYGVYHGRFVATLLSHFDTLMDEVRITPMIDTDYDVIA